MAQALQRRNRRNAINNNSVQRRLEGELERAKRITGLGHNDLGVRWSPNPGSDRHGEVRGNVIYIFDLDEQEALKTLRHEFIDYNVSREVVEPLIEYVNMQKHIIESLIYRRKERLVDRLSELL